MRWRFAGSCRQQRWSARATAPIRPRWRGSSVTTTCSRAGIPQRAWPRSRQPTGELGGGQLRCLVRGGRVVVGARAGDRRALRGAEHANDRHPDGLPSGLPGHGRARFSARRAASAGGAARRRSCSSGSIPSGVDRARSSRVRLALPHGGVRTAHGTPGVLVHFNGYSRHRAEGTRRARRAIAAAVRRGRRARRDPRDCDGTSEQLAPKTDSFSLTPGDRVARRAAARWR